MPAMLEDPAAATIYRVSGAAPFPDPTKPSLPETILPRQVTLRDRQTVATVVPFASRYQVPESLLRYLNDQFNKEIEGGDTYPMMDMLSFDKFASYWFQNFGAIMLLGNIERPEDVIDGKDWSKECLGTFYIKPNYPGRSSHVCNAGFIVTDASRNRGVGRLMGETYLEWAPKLGYSYSVFNLVYETNVASCKIWDALGFKRIGRVKGAGNLKSHPDRLVDAIIFGRDLGDGAGGAGNEELVSEERFDKIKFYLKYGRYPNGADRAEKSRLRSAATHYKLVDGDVLMLKDKEVISDPQRQYEIARSVHNLAHVGINKTTATIAERYHWSRIKETVSDVIRNCVECKEEKEESKNSASQARQASPMVGPVAGQKRPHPSLNAASGAPSSKRSSPSPSVTGSLADVNAAGQSRPTPMSSISDPSHLSPFTLPAHQFADPTEDISLISPSARSIPNSSSDTMVDAISQHTHNPMLQDSPHSTGLHSPTHHHHRHHPPVVLPPLAGVSVSVSMSDSVYQPIDPQIISQPSTSSTPRVDPAFLRHIHTPHYSFDHPSPHPHDHHHHHHHHHHNPHAHDPDADTFQALLNATDDDVDVDVDVNVVGPGAGAIPGNEHHATHTHSHDHPHQTHGHHDHHRTPEEDEAERAAVDRDMEMLIEQPQEDEDDVEIAAETGGGGVPSQEQQDQDKNESIGGSGEGSGVMDVDSTVAPPLPPASKEGDGGVQPAAVGAGDGGETSMVMDEVGTPQPGPSDKGFQAPPT